MKPYLIYGKSVFNLLTNEVMKHSDNETLCILGQIKAEHILLPDAPLIRETYKGIIGYYCWLKNNPKHSSHFLHTAIHDLLGCQKYDRNDGYCPRTSSYVQFYNSKVNEDEKS